MDDEKLGFIVDQVTDKLLIQINDNCIEQGIDLSKLPDKEQINDMLNIIGVLVGKVCFKTSQYHNAYLGDNLDEMKVLDDIYNYVESFIEVNLPIQKKERLND